MLWKHFWGILLLFTIVMEPAYSVDTESVVVAGKRRRHHHRKHVVEDDLWFDSTMAQRVSFASLYPEFPGSSVVLPTFTSSEIEKRKKTIIGETDQATEDKQITPKQIALLETPTFNAKTCANIICVCRILFGRLAAAFNAFLRDVQSGKEDVCSLSFAVREARECATIMDKAQKQLFGLSCDAFCDVVVREKVDGSYGRYFRKRKPNKELAEYAVELLANTTDALFAFLWFAFGNRFPGDDAYQQFGISGETIGSVLQGWRQTVRQLCKNYPELSALSEEPTFFVDCFEVELGWEGYKIDLRKLGNVVLALNEVETAISKIVCPTSQASPQTVIRGPFSHPLTSSVTASPHLDAAVS
ncbi:MAG: hypothetical protein LBF84_03750 [Holosporales bacterium]|jgi:hypothetical protein|nr:hypothetical protein [Holosporales bacterium]